MTSFIQVTGQESSDYPIILNIDHIICIRKNSSSRKKLKGSIIDTVRGPLIVSESYELVVEKLNIYLER